MHRTTSPALPEPRLPAPARPTGAALERPALSLTEGTGARAVREWLERHTSPNTRAAYRADLHHFLEWMRSELGHTNPRLVTVAQMGLYLAHRVRAGDANKTAARRMSTVSSLYQHLLAAGEVTLNPADHRLVRRPRSNRADKPTPWVEASTLARLYEAASTDSTRADLIFTLTGIYGLRASEVGWLTLGDIHDTPHGCTLVVRGKGGRVDRVEVDQQTCDVLARWLEERWHILEGMGRDPEDPALPLVVNVHGPGRGNAMTRNGVAQCVATVSSRVLPSALTPHSLRKSTAMMLHEGGMSSLELRQWGRWASLTTVQVYVEMAQARTQPGLLVREVLQEQSAQSARRHHGGTLSRPTRTSMANHPRHAGREQ